MIQRREASNVKYVRRRNPVIGAVATHHLGLAAQIPVGCRVRFNVVAPFFEQVTP